MELQGEVLLYYLQGLSRLDFIAISPWSKLDIHGIHMVGHGVDDWHMCFFHQVWTFAIVQKSCFLWWTWDCCAVQIGFDPPVKMVLFNQENNSLVCYGWNRTWSMIHMGLPEMFAYPKIQLYVIMFLLKRPWNSGVYPLVNIYTTMENHHVWGKSTK